MRIDLFLPSKSQYDVRKWFTFELSAALKRAYVDSEVVPMVKGAFETYLKTKRKPNFTLSFNPINANAKKEEIFHHTLRPHIVWLIDSPIHLMHASKSDRFLWCPVDRMWQELMVASGFKSVRFLPHAISKGLSFDPSAQRPIPVALFSSCIDPGAWQEQFSKKIVSLIKEAVEVALMDRTSSIFDAWMEVFKNAKNVEVDTVACIKAVDLLVRAEDRLRLARTMAPLGLHIFGEPVALWKQLVPDAVVHDGVDFIKALHLMQQSKVVLNSTPTIKFGSHERILAAMSLGAACVTAQNPYLSTHFEEGKELVLFKTGQWEEGRERVKLLLANEDMRREMAFHGRERVQNEHTFDARVKELLPWLRTIVGDEY